MSVISVNENNFDKEVLHSSIPVLVDFWAPWCAPCRQVAPILKEIQDSFEKKIKVVKVDVDGNETLAQNYNIRGIPTLVLFKEGKVVENRVGALTKDSLHSWVESIV